MKNFWYIGVVAGCAALTILFVLVGGSVAVAYLVIGGGSNKGTGTSASNSCTWSGSTETVTKLAGVDLPATGGKLGHEEHIPEVTSSGQRCFNEGETHYSDKNSHPLSYVSNCAAMGHYRKTTEQERWYFNMRWDTSGNYPEDIVHKKIILTNPVNGRKVVVSVEEYGPASYLMSRDGINSGAPPDVYNYLDLPNPYTKDPGDKRGYVSIGFAKDQNICLGPLEEDKITN